MVVGTLRKSRLRYPVICVVDSFERMSGYAQRKERHPGASQHSSRSNLFLSVRHDCTSLPLSHAARSKGRALLVSAVRGAPPFAALAVRTTYGKAR